MVPVEGNMELLSQAVLTEAHHEAEQVLAGAKEKADVIRQNAQAQAEKDRKEILARAQVEAERIQRQAIATAQIQARTIQLEHREKMLGKVFEEARQQLPTIQQWNDYEHIARHLLHEALIHLGANQVKIQADPNTLQAFKKAMLAEISKEINVELHVGEPLKQGLGVIVETEDGRRRYDNTLETRLSRMQDALRNPVYHILIGEPQ